MALRRFRVKYSDKEPTDLDVIGRRRSHRANLDLHVGVALPSLGVEFLKRRFAALAGLGFVLGLDQDVFGERPALKVDRSAAGD